MTIDTSAEGVERMAKWHEECGITPGDPDCVTAALLRALVAERDHWKATFHARYVEDVRDTKDAYARGWREGAAAMQNMAVSTCDAAAWQHPNARLLGPELKSAGCANAIRALPLPEPQA